MDVARMIKLNSSDSAREEALIRNGTPRKGNFMQTWSGSLYWPLDPRAEEVHIEDLAHHLSQICRYTGACEEFYSVAEHSVHVSYIAPPEMALLGLLHDATEAYLNDLNRPVKHDPELAGYRRVEALNWRVIAARFGLPEVMPEDIHVADAAMLAAERRVLMKPLPQVTTHAWMMGDVQPPAKVDIWCWPPKFAKQMFLRRYEELTR